MKLYESVQKSNNYIYGSKLVDENSNPFLEGPCLLCITPAMINNKSVFGITKEGMKLARLRVRGSENARFDVSNFPVKFISVKSETSKESYLNEKEQLQEFINTYFIPLISNENKKINVNTAMRNMRNVNIISYCDATLIVQDMENLILDKMHKLGYTNEECSMIQSQMFMLPIATNRLEGKQKSTCISFRDINDEELLDPNEDELAEDIEKLPIQEKIIEKSNNELEYIIFGEGKHDLKLYGENGKAFKVCMSSVITNALENSIKNSQSTDEFIPINLQILIKDLPNIMKKAENGIDVNILMQSLDEKLNYGNARKLSKYEIQLLDQIDELCDNKTKMLRELSDTQKSLDKAKVYLERTNQVIEENCTGDIQRKVLIAQGYQFADDDKHIKKAQRLEQSVKESKELDNKIEKIKEKER